MRTPHFLDAKGNSDSTNYAAEVKEWNLNCAFVCRRAGEVCLWSRHHQFTGQEPLIAKKSWAGKLLPTRSFLLAGLNVERPFTLEDTPFQKLLYASLPLWRHIKLLLSILQGSNFCPTCHIFKEQDFWQVATIAVTMLIRLIKSLHAKNFILLK